MPLLRLGQIWKTEIILNDFKLDQFLAGICCFILTCHFGENETTDGGVKISLRTELSLIASNCDINYNNNNIVKQDNDVVELSQSYIIIIINVIKAIRHFTIVSKDSWQFAILQSFLQSLPYTLSERVVYCWCFAIFHILPFDD